MKQRKEQRTKKMMFRVGMIVTCHNKVTSRSLPGVIIGWDEEFNPRVETEWMQCRPLYNRSVLGSNILAQPFYKVLCDEDIAYYAVEGINKLLKTPYRFIYFIDIFIYYIACLYIFYNLIYIMYKKIYFFDYRCHGEKFFSDSDKT